jgi:ribosomal protein S12 methylthiotransferase
MNEREKKVIYLRSLGCSKNTVDSEVMLALLQKAGYRITEKPEDAAGIIINTCAFIDSAKEEAIDSILELAEHRKNGAKLIVAGCLAQLHWRQLLEEMPEIDAVVGTGNLEYVIEAVSTGSGGRNFAESRLTGRRYREYGRRGTLLSTPGSAYLKISEGCSRGCSYCLIPKIRGSMRSRSLRSIIDEGRYLREQGIHEIILTSQDTLSYGNDLLGRTRCGLDNVIRGLLEETSVELLRLLYMRPSPELFRLEVLFRDARLLPYFDIPIQHVSPRILRSMNRSGGAQEYGELMERIREKIPGAVLRTTVIVGFPGESERDFDMLLSFIRKVRFDHLGVFAFSPQEGTAAFSLKERVSKNIAEERRRTLMSVQQDISRGRLGRFVGRTFPVLVEERFEGDNLYIGRSYHFAPEVDGLFLIRSEKAIDPGSIVAARVTAAGDYDLHGVPVDG